MAENKKYEIYLDNGNVRIKNIIDVNKTGHIYDSAKSVASFIVNYLQTNENASYQDFKISDKIFDGPRFSSNKKFKEDVDEELLETRAYNTCNTKNKRGEDITLVEFTFRDELYDRLSEYIATREGNQKLYKKWKAENDKNDLDPKTAFDTIMSAMD